MEEFRDGILVSIADHLGLTQKLELALICKKFHEVLLQTNLYSKLTFKILDKFHQAVKLFNKKQNIKQNVRDLALCYMRCDDRMELALLLLRLFLNITTLEWKDNLARKSIIDKEVESTYDEALQQWKNIESLVDRLRHLDIATHLLRSYHCDRLTRLEVSFGEQKEENGRLFTLRDGL